MNPAKIGLTVIVWIILGVLITWNGTGFILGKTSIEFLQDDAVRLIAQILAVVFGTSVVAGFGSWVTIFFMIATEK